MKKGDIIEILDNMDEKIEATYLGKEKIKGVHRVLIRKSKGTKTWYIPESRIVTKTLADLLH